MDPVKAISNGAAPGGALNRTKHLLHLLSATLAFFLCGCGAGGESPAGADFLLNRKTFLNLLELRGASQEERLGVVDDILQDATASASSNGIDENVVRFAELARAVIGIRMARMSDSTDDPAGGAGILPERWRIYRQYLEVARALAEIYAPELAARFDGSILQLEELSGAPDQGSLDAVFDDALDSIQPDGPAR